MSFTLIELEYELKNQRHYYNRTDKSRFPTTISTSIQNITPENSVWGDIRIDSVEEVAIPILFHADGPLILTEHEKRRYKVQGESDPKVNPTDRDRLRLKQQREKEIHDRQKSEEDERRKLMKEFDGLDKQAKIDIMQGVDYHVPLMITHCFLWDDKIQGYYYCFSPGGLPKELYAYDRAWGAARERHLIEKGEWVWVKNGDGKITEYNSPVPKR